MTVLWNAELTFQQGIPQTSRFSLKLNLKLKNILEVLPETR